MSRIHFHIWYTTICSCHLHIAPVRLQLITAHTLIAICGGWSTILGTTLASAVRPPCWTGIPCWGRCRHCSGNYEARGASGGKYKARIAIFWILAIIDRFAQIPWKVESHWGKSESHWGKQKAIEESKENRIWGKENRIFRREKSRYFPRDSLVSGNLETLFATWFATTCAHWFTLLNSSTHN